MKKIIITIFTAFSSYLYSQNIGINTTGALAHPSAIFDADASPANNKGALMPRVALIATNNNSPVTAPATSLLVYNTATSGVGATAVTPGYYYWDGTQWVAFRVNIPTGIIVMWSGSVGTIPAGWAFCDGTNGTPDLRDRFILAAGTVNAVATTGGVDNITLTTANLPAHTHSGTTSTNGDHFHVQGPNAAGVFYSDPLPAELNAGMMNGGHFNDSGASGISRGGFQTSTTGNHNHTFTTDAMPAATGFDNRPVYYTLAYIMKL